MIGLEMLVKRHSSLSSSTKLTESQLLRSGSRMVISKAEVNAEVMTTGGAILSAGSLRMGYSEVIAQKPARTINFRSRPA